MALPVIGGVLGVVGTLALAYYVGSEIADRFDPPAMCELQGSVYKLEEGYHECTYRCGDGRLIIIRAQQGSGCPLSFPRP